MALIEAVHLSKSYHDEEVETRALDDASFKIEAGEFVAVMGPSGSGKSTLLHILGFLDYPTGGKYRFNDRSIEEYDENELAKVRNKKMGFVFQSFNLLPRVTVLENIKLPLIYSDTKEKKWNDLAMEAAPSVGLSHRIDYEPSQLFGGDKQRAALARALVNQR